MKRQGNLYNRICKIAVIREGFEHVISRLKNKREVENASKNKISIITEIYEELNNRTYFPSKPNKFIIYEPKKREIVNLKLKDKIVNYILSKYILVPVLDSCLINTNVASRKDYGMRVALEKMFKYRRKCNINYKEYYILKMDISKYFKSINHAILKNKLKCKIKDKDALSLISFFIDMQEGLAIGMMTSQILAVFYLNDIDHFIKEELKCKYYIRYQDDLIIFHKSKKYLKHCFKKIEQKLLEEDLKLNPKSRIHKNTDNIIYLGRDLKGKYAKRKEIRKKYNRKLEQYYNNEIILNSFISSKRCFKTIKRKYKLKKIKI